MALRTVRRRAPHLLAAITALSLLTSCTVNGVGSPDIPAVSVAPGGPDSVGAPSEQRALSLGKLLATLDVDAATAALATLTVVSEQPHGYDRDAFGPAWSDVDGNGCNQRDDVLVRDASSGTVRTQAQGDCAHDVVAGQWLDPYTGAVLTFTNLKDPEQAQAIPIDHVVPLAEAHRSGAHAWSAGRREQFANDTANLVAVGGAANAAKSDADPAGWLPPEPVRCAYARVWVDVKARWVLTVDPAEGAALSAVLDGCSTDGG